MMKWTRFRAIHGALWLTVALFCAVGGQSALRAALPDASNQVACRFEGGEAAPGFSVVNTLRVRMGDSAADGLAQAQVAAWAQVSGVQAMVVETGGSVLADALWIDGPARLIWDWRAMAGSLPDFGSARICALDTGTALRLFGSTDVIGQMVEVGGERLTVACVFELPQGLGVLGADTGSGLVLCPAQALANPPPIHGLDFSVLSFDAQPIDEWVSFWLSAAGISSPAYSDVRSQQETMLVLAAQVPSIMLALLILCPLMVAAVGLIRATAKRCAAQWGDRLAPASQGWRTLGAGLAGVSLLLALAALALFLPRIHIHVPPSYLPTRWSNVNFWPTLITQHGQESARRLMFGALRPDMVRNHWITLSAGLSLAAAPLLWLAWRAFGQAAQPGTPILALLWPALAACASAVLALQAAEWLGWPPSAPPALAVLAVSLSVIPPLLLAHPPAELLKIHKEEFLT